MPARTGGAAGRPPGRHASGTVAVRALPKLRLSRPHAGAAAQATMASSASTTSRISGGHGPSPQRRQNSPPNNSRCNALRRLACDGRRAASSHGESLRSHSCPNGCSQAHHSTTV
jgi:hypothetical protein